MGRRHKWRAIKGSPVKGEFEHKKCTKCGIEVRKIRKGSTQAFRGWVEIWYRERGCSLWDCVGRRVRKLPECEGSAGTCPTCGATTNAKTGV